MEDDENIHEAYPNYLLQNPDNFSPDLVEMAKYYYDLKKKWNWVGEVLSKQCKIYDESYNFSEDMLKKIYDKIRNDSWASWEYLTSKTKFLDVMFSEFRTVEKESEQVRSDPKEVCA